jgi:hypothetical protein
MESMNVNFCIFHDQRNHHIWKPTNHYGRI